MKTVRIPVEELESIEERLHNIEKHLLTQHHQLSDPVFDTLGIMKLLNVSRRCLQTWRDQSLLEYSAVQGKFYYRLSAINRMLDNHLQKAEGSPWK